MKLPRNIEGICRDGRMDSYQSEGIEPSRWGLIGKIGRGIKKIGGFLRKPACIACNLIPNPVGKAACKAIACR